SQVMRAAHAPPETRSGEEPELQPAQSRRQAPVRIHRMANDPIPVTRSVSIPRDEVELRFSRSSGPGGQHAQKSDTRVEAVFDVEASSALSDAQKRGGGGGGGRGAGGGG